MRAAAAAALALDSHPSDLVLVNAYLRPWVARGLLAGAFVHAADLYSVEPGDLARRFRAAVARDGERAWYFLSPLRAKSPRGRRKARTVAGGSGGWWHGEAGPKPVIDPLDGGRQVGYRQNFSFMKRGGDGAPVRTGWIMVELRLHDDGDDDGGGRIGEQLEGLVLCKVYRSPRHPAVAPDGDEEESCAAAAPSASHGGADDDNNGSSDAPVMAAAAFGGNRKADDEDESSGTSVASPRRQIKNAGGVETSAGAAVATPPGLEEKAADEENEISGVTTAAAPGREEEMAADDRDSSSPARKRAKKADDECPAAASSRWRKAGTLAMTQQVRYCPQCGIHLGAFQVVVAPPANDKNEVSGETTAAAPGREEDNAADYRDSSPARKRAKKADDEGAGAASALRRKAGTPAMTQHLHYCPQCGFHLATFQVVVAPANAPAPAGGERTGDRPFHRFL